MIFAGMFAAVFGSKKKEESKKIKVPIEPHMIVTLRHGIVGNPERVLQVEVNGMILMYARLSSGEVERLVAGHPVLARGVFGDENHV